MDRTALLFTLIFVYPAKINSWQIATINNNEMTWDEVKFGTMVIHSASQ